MFRAAVSVVATFLVGPATADPRTHCRLDRARNGLETGTAPRLWRTRRCLSLASSGIEPHHGWKGAGEVANIGAAVLVTACPARLIMFQKVSHTKRKERDLLEAIADAVVSTDAAALH